MKLFLKFLDMWQKSSAHYLELSTVIQYHCHCPTQIPTPSRCMAPCGTPNSSLYGPATDDLHFPVNKTFWNSCFMYAITKFIQFSVQIAVNSGLTDGFHTKTIPCSTLQCAAKGTNWTPGSWKCLMVVTMTFWLQFSSIFFCPGHNIFLS